MLIFSYFSQGFGDYVPGKTFRGDMTVTQFFKMTFSTLYCLLGLALIAMGINLASEQVPTHFLILYCQLGLTLLAMGNQLSFRTGLMNFRFCTVYWGWP
jgi:hypothetical protein